VSDPLRWNTLDTSVQNTALCKKFSWDTHLKQTLITSDIIISWYSFEECQPDVFIWRAPSRIHWFHNVPYELKCIAKPKIVLVNDTRNGIDRFNDLNRCLRCFAMSLLALQNFCIRRANCGISDYCFQPFILIIISRFDA